MSDLIRRKDALKAIDPGYGDFHAGNYNAIAALPAVQPDAAARSKTIREFCDKAGIRLSQEVAGLPDDVKLWRMETAVAARLKGDSHE